tara:strand:+ start:435 stop:629 length:195 start_codon:yes stop_codon:yes gene_type:complete
METIVFELQLIDGRIFRIFCANSTQKKKVIDEYFKLKHSGVALKLETITNGIHTVKQLKEIINQ